MSQWQWLGFAVALVLTIFIGALAALILWLIIRDRIKLDKLISEPNGQASLSRFQFLVFTFVIALSLFYLIAIHQEFPKLPPEILGLLGISGGSYVISKGIQNSRDTNIERIRSGRGGSDREDSDSTETGPNL